MSEIRSYREADEAALVALWEACGLTRPWNPPAADIAQVRRSGHGDILVAVAGEAVVGSVVVGHDGHRGWVYYLAVAPEERRDGLGRRLMAAAEAWVAARGVRKLELMVRDSNAAVAEFYQRIGYEREPVRVMSRWLDGTGRCDGAAGMAMLDDVITYLEMRERPSGPPVPAPLGQHALMRAQHCTVAFYRHLYETVGTPWLWYERRLMSDAALADEIRKPTTEIFVLYVGGVPAGYFELDAAPPRETELRYFGLIPEFIGRGFGPFLLRTAVDQAWSRPIERLWVHTRMFDHPKALGYYQRAGFVVYARRPLRFEDPRVAGILPRSLTHPLLPPLDDSRP